MKADPAAQRRLLDLQAIDTALGQLAHRRGALPELAEIADGTKQLTGLSDAVAAARADVDDLGRDVRRLEMDVEQVRNRATKDQQRMQAGGLPSKELERLQHEVDSLARRASSLEDDELELMEKREEAETVLAAAESAKAAVDTTVVAATERRDAAFVEIDAETDKRGAERAAIVPNMPDDLLKLYERIRSTSGIGAALLRARRCEGCRLELAGSDYAAIKKASPDEVIRHEECGRILVRTDMSGL
ncbi:zinc ribbon domain-containing protein [Fodinicola feengrottensis]|uniref:C4-type zinc ribbon domain-containing protein n=1 Tax=Fodinicola feengrottensis TaxID=435914 RepID=A0ABP4S8C1_9ACTN|nr:C4-type zinc ribbon domain-containing protein [Fodinicola feengrottensis]